VNLSFTNQLDKRQQILLTSPVIHHLYLWSMTGKFQLNFCKIEVRHTFEKKKSCLSIFSLKKSYA